MLICCLSILGPAHSKRIFPWIYNIQKAMCKDDNLFIFLWPYTLYNKINDLKKQFKLVEYRTIQCSTTM